MKSVTIFRISHTVLLYYMWGLLPCCFTFLWNYQELFPMVNNRLQQKIHFITDHVTGHGWIKVHYQRFKLKEKPTCNYNIGNQTVDHIIYDCTMFKKESELLGQRRNRTLKGGNWPANKTDLSRIYFKEFYKSGNTLKLKEIK